MSAAQDPMLQERIQKEKEQRNLPPVYKATQWSNGIEKDVRNIRDALSKMNKEDELNNKVKEVYNQEFNDWVPGDAHFHRPFG